MSSTAPSTTIPSIQENTTHKSTTSRLKSVSNWLANQTLNSFYRKLKSLKTERPIYVKNGLDLRPYKPFSQSLSQSLSQPLSQLTNPLSHPLSYPLSYPLSQPLSQSTQLSKRRNYKRQIWRRLRRRLRRTLWRIL